MRRWNFKKRLVIGGAREHLKKSQESEVVPAQTQFHALCKRTNNDDTRGELRTMETEAAEKIDAAQRVRVLLVGMDET